MFIELASYGPMNLEAIFPGGGQADSAAADRVRANCEGLLASLAVGRALMECGRDVDLADVDFRIGRLCAQTIDLPPQLGRSCRPQLSALLVEVDRIRKLLGADRN